MKKYSFTDHPEHEEQLAAWRDKWIANALSLEPANQPKMRQAIDGLYRSADLTPPPANRVVFVKSPQVAAIAGSIAAGAWWIRKHPMDAARIGIRVTETELMASVGQAAFLATSAALGKPVPIPVQRAATYDVTYDATYAATRAATRAATYDATNDATVRFLVGCCVGWYRLHQGGSDWAGWSAYLSFFDRVAHLELPVYDKWRYYEQASLHGASRIMHQEFCVVADRQTEIHIETVQGIGRLHSAGGPARAWGDGFKVYYWHGVRVPEWVIENPTVEKAMQESNSEIRRAAFESIGWDKAIEQMNLTPIGTCADPGNAPHSLTLYSLPEQIYDEPVNLLLMVNGSPDRDGNQRMYGETVPAAIKDPLSAAAWQYGVTTDVYAQLARRS